jgi:asparagine synthase (glutamine-hydrolysing)
VALSGDAGDELFGGYNRYFWGPRIWAKLAWLPYTVRQALGAAISAMPIAGWNALCGPKNVFLPRGKVIINAGDKAQNLAARLRSVSNLDDLYLSLVSEWQDPAQVVRGVNSCPVVEPRSVLADPLPEGDLTDETKSPLRMMYRDSMTYLPDDILCKVDRAAMATSLETRLPFLDHRVAELAWRMPLQMKIRGEQGKWALRQVLYKHVSRELIDRPKAGFGIPIGHWLRGPLRSWAESLLDQNRLNAEGYFYSRPIRKKWAEHLAGQHDHTASLWTVLMFQAWLEGQ